MSCCVCNPNANGGNTQGGTKIESYVKVVAGGFTDELKEKLEGIEENANKYVLPNATAEQLGGIKVGQGLVIADDGTLSISEDYVPGGGDGCDCDDTQILDGGNAEGSIEEEEIEEVIQYLDGGDSDGIWD